MKLSEFIVLVKKNSRLLACDVGEKTVGLALSDKSHMIATSLETIQRQKFRDIVQRFNVLIKERGIGGFIIGLPLNMDGTEGPRCEASRAFAKNLSEHFALPIGFWDERLSTMAVERVMIEADMSRAKRKKVVDKTAACYILQGALDYLTNRKLRI
jgi:putative pre-16S rRNA nuclease